MAHDIGALERKFRNLDQTVSKLVSGKHVEQLIPIIHKPGWTTVAEAQLVHAMVDHLQTQADGLVRAYDALLAAAQKVGTSSSSA